MNFWPKISRSLPSFLGHWASKEDIEIFFEKMYPSYKAVFFSSARSSICTILDYYSISREDRVFLPEFSSHCLLNVVSKFGSPVIGFEENGKIAIAYHQFGHKNKLEKKYETVIEDSVDSLVLDESSLFINNGEFEIFSLPKIFGCVSGSIVICKNTNLASSLKKVRNNKEHFYKLQYFLRLTSWCNHLWDAGEHFNTKVPQLGLNNIMSCLSKIDLLIKNRKENIIRIKKKLPELDTQKIDDNRLPCALVYKKSDSTIKHLEKEGILFSERVFTLIKPLEKVLVIPVHQSSRN